MEGGWETVRRELIWIYSLPQKGISREVLIATDSHLHASKETYRIYS